MDCVDLSKIVDFECCGSCHTDEMEYDIDLGEEEYNGITYFTCCGGREAIRKLKES